MDKLRFKKKLEENSRCCSGAKQRVRGCNRHGQFSDERVHHGDRLSIDFTNEIGEIRKDGFSFYDKKGHVIGIDLTDSAKLFWSQLTRCRFKRLCTS